MGIAMLGGGIAGQPGFMAFPIAPGKTTGYPQVYPSGHQGWAPMPGGGLGMPLSPPEEQPALAPTTGSSFAPGVKTFIPASLYAAGGSRTQHGGSQFPIFRPQSRAAEAPAVGQRHSST